MASLSGVSNLQVFTSAGALAAGYRLYTYAYGTTTHKAAYVDAAGATPHTYTSDGSGGQYIAVDARGELPAPLYYATGSYDLCLKTSAGATVWTRRADPVADAGYLADATDAAKGAGMVGFLYSLAYASGTIGRWLKDLATSTGSTFIGFLQSGTSGTLRTVQDKLREWAVTPSDYSGASVSLKIDAALAGADGRLVIIPPDVGAGGPTTPVDTESVLDLRGANGYAGGRSILVNFSDANGTNLLTLLNQMKDYNQSTGALVCVTRPLPGALFNGENQEGLQAVASMSGAYTGGGASTVMTGAEFGVDIAATGGHVGAAWGSHSQAALLATTTTTVDEVAGHVCVNVKNEGSGTPARMFGLIVHDVTGAATRKGAALLKGDVVFGGVLAQEADAPAIASAATIAPTKWVSFVSGTTTISNITPPSSISGFTGQIVLIPSGLWATNTAGNIGLATTAVTGKPLIMTYASGQWWPSYT